MDAGGDTFFDTESVTSIEDAALKLDGPTKSKFLGTNNKDESESLIRNESVQRVPDIESDGLVDESKEHNDPVDKYKEPNDTVDESKEEENEDDEWLDILGSGQLKKKILQKAENQYRPQRSDIVVINIEGRLEDGTIVDKETNRSLQIGDAEHIQALDLALPLMDVGETALLEVAPRFAYGSQGREPDVPANARITYTIELLNSEPEPDVETLPASKRKENGCLKKERGNFWYSRQEYTLAIQCYRRALNFLDDIDGGGITLPPSEDGVVDKDKENAELQELLDERLVVYNNLAAAQLKLNALDSALNSVNSVLRCKPHNVKALFRKGQVLAAKGDYSQAEGILRRASQLEPKNAAIRNELTQVSSLLKEQVKLERNLYKKMMGQDKQPEESTPENHKESSKSLLSAQFQFPWSILFGTLAAMVAGVMAYRYKFI